MCVGRLLVAKTLQEFRANLFIVILSFGRAKLIYTNSFMIIRMAYGMRCGMQHELLSSSLEV